MFNVYNKSSLIFILLCLRKLHFFVIIGLCTWSEGKSGNHTNSFIILLKILLNNYRASLVLAISSIRYLMQTINLAELFYASQFFMLFSLH